MQQLRTNSKRAMDMDASVRDLQRCPLVVVAAGGIRNLHQHRVHNENVFQSLQGCSWQVAPSSFNLNPLAYEIMFSGKGATAGLRTEGKGPGFFREICTYAYGELVG